MFLKRPFGVTLLLWLVLSLSAWGAVRLIAALRFWNLLNEFEASLSPVYLAFIGAGWMVAGAVLLWGVFRGSRWTYWAIPVSVTLWLVQYWIERIFFQSPRANGVFALLLTVLLFALTLASAFNRKTREFLIKSEAHEQPDPNTDTA